MTTESTRRACFDTPDLTRRHRPGHRRRAARMTPAGAGRVLRQLPCTGVRSAAVVDHSACRAARRVGAASAVMARGGFAGSLTRKSRMGVHSPAAMASDEAFGVGQPGRRPDRRRRCRGRRWWRPSWWSSCRCRRSASLVVGLVGLAGSVVLLLVAGVLGDRAARQVPIPARKPTSAGGAGCRDVRAAAAAAPGSAAAIQRPRPVRPEPRQPASECGTTKEWSTV